MSDLIVYGDIRSAYVRTALMTCEEKGAPYRLEAVDIASEAYRALHPFGRMPSLRYGDLVLYETSAIVHYVNAAFDGPALLPGDAAGAARVEQWISTTVDYLYDAMIRRFVLQFIFPTGPDGTPDKAVVEAARVDIAYQLGLLDRNLEGRSWMVGNELTLADLFVTPILGYVGHFPGGAELMAAAPNVATYLSRVGERASFKATLPPRGE